MGNDRNGFGNNVTNDVDNKMKTKERKKRYTLFIKSEEQGFYCPGTIEVTVEAKDEKEAEKLALDKLFVEFVNIKL